MENVGTRVRRLCEEKQISVAELERALNVGNGTIARWEKKAVPSAGTVAKAADYFGVSIDYLMCRTDERDTFEYWNKKYNIKELSKQSKQICTIAAHLDEQLEGKNVSDKEIELLKQYIDTLFK